MNDPRVKQLKIKTGVVKRLTKEKITYEKEAVTQKQKIEKMKAAGSDSYDIKKQEEVLQECLMMVPDCQRRLAKGFEDLKNILESEIDMKELEEFGTAQQILEEAKLQLPNSEELATAC